MASEGAAPVTSGTIRITPPKWQAMITMMKRHKDSPHFIEGMLDEFARLARIADDEDPEYVIVKREEEPAITPEEQQAVFDVLTTCLEGGSNYWLANEPVEVVGEFRGKWASEHVSLGGTVILTEHDDDGEVAKHELTREKMLAGMRRAAEHFGQSFAAFVEDHDGSSADVALQFAVLGEIRYG